MHKKFALVVAASILFASCAQAQDKATPMRLERLASPDTAVRRHVSEELYGTGISDSQTWDAVAKLLEAQLLEVKRGDERVDEVSRHLQLLGASGDIRYMPILEAGTKSQVRGIASDARDARELLLKTSALGKPLLEAEKVRLVTEKQADDCAYIGQKSCADRGGTVESCTEELQQDTLDSGGDSILLVNQSTGGGWLGVASVTANLYRCNSTSTR